MPYIEQSDRDFLNISDFANAIQNVGELNFTITRLLMGYLKDRGISYANLNEIIGVLECIKQEFYRRVVAPYEDKKKLENGDVF